MGSPFHLLFYANDSASASRLAEQAFLLVDSLNLVFSDYLPGSELSRFSQTAGSRKSVPLSAPLYEVLLRSQEASQKSKGAFALTIGPLSHLWRAARRGKTFPSADSVRLARKRSDYRHLQIDTVAKKASLLLTGMQLDPGGIAKGYIAQQVIRFLQANGISAALADAGGDIACSGPPPGKEGWTVGINVPGDGDAILPETLTVRNSAVATSGDIYQFIEHNGKRYSHIVDPRTGYGVPFQRNVTVIAADGATADWLATACSILPIKESLRLADAENAALLITQVHKGKPGYHMNSRMRKRLRR